MFVACRVGQSVATAIENVVEISGEQVDRENAYNAVGEASCRKLVTTRKFEDEPDGEDGRDCIEKRLDSILRHLVMSLVL